MTEETTAPQGEPQGEPAQTVETPAQDTTTEQPQDTAPAADQATSEPEKPKKRPWYEVRLSEVSEKKNEAEAKAKALEEQNAALLAALAAKGGPEASTQPPATQTTPQNTVNQADIDRMVQQKAAELAKTQQFTEACNRSYNAGKAEFTDFDEAVRNLGMVGAMGQNANPAFLEIVTEMPEGHKVIHHLGKNLDEAARLVNLPPTKLALELARVEAFLSKPAPARAISNAPPPIRTIDGNGKAEPRLDDPKIPMHDWVRMRREQRAAKNKR